MGRKPKTPRNAYGAWLHLLRKEKDLSQHEAARQTGIPRTTLMNWERTGSLTGRDKILKLAKIYGVSVQNSCVPKNPVKIKFGSIDFPGINNLLAPIIRV